MRKITFCLMMFFVLTVNSAHAGDGHNHDNELSLNQIQEKASGFVARIVGKGQLDASWTELKPQKTQETSNHEWLVTFVNPEIKDHEKQTLYMFMTLSGEYIAANFTGQ